MFHPIHFKKAKRRINKVDSMKQFIKNTTKNLRNLPNQREN